MTTSMFASLLLEVYQKMVEIAEIDIETCNFHSYTVNHLLEDCPGVYINEGLGFFKFSSFMTRAAFEVIKDKKERSAFLNVFSRAVLFDEKPILYWNTKLFLGKNSAEYFNESARKMVEKYLED